mgnify:CR=1 FL=1
MTLVHPAFAPLDAPTLVEASAGTGKTYTITTYFVRAIVEQGLSPKDILIVTYTRAATSELRARARERIVDALARLEGRGGEPDVLDEIIAQASEYHGRAELERRLRNALGSMDQAAIFTIHGFCQRLLQDHPLVFGIDFDFEVAEDRSSLHAELASDFWASDLHRQPEWLVRALADQTVTTKHLTEIANKCAMPGVEIVGPEPIEMNDRLMDRALEAKRSAASVWFEQREQVAAILRDDPGLHRNRYPKKSMPTWGSQLDDYFAKGGLVGAPDFLPKLAAGEMSVKNGQTEPEHPFFDACATLVEDFDRSHTELASSLGRSRPSISNLMRLLELPEDVQELVAEGRLSEGAARAVLQADGAKARRALAERIVAEGLSVREAESLGRAEEKRSRRRNSRPVPQAADDAASSFMDVFETPVRVRRAGKEGLVLELRFENEAALEAAVARLETGAPTEPTGA